MNMIIKNAVFLLFFATTIYSAPTNQELFLQANAAYAARDYEGALALYTTVSNKGSVIWYNMGNCAYHLQHYPDAYIYWKKSEQGASWSLLNDAEHNLALLVHGSSDETVSAYQRVTHTLRLYLLWSSLWWLQAALLLIWSVFWLLYVRRAPRVLQGTVLLLICCCGIALKGKYSDTFTMSGLVIRAQAPVYTGPDTKFQRITMLDEMAEVVIRQKKKNWYKISYKNQIGWMPADSITVV
jgi:tetratricopeptide (TPR) repeat protein